MKRKLALFLAVLMTFFGTLSASALDRSLLDSMIERAAGYTAEERNALIQNVAVFAGAEANLEIVCRQIDEQSGMVYSMLKPTVDQLGADCVKAMLRSIVSFGCENIQNVLYAYADAKTKPEPLAISDTVKRAMQVLNTAFSESNENLGEMLAADGINESVLAYMTKTLFQNVKYKELFGYRKSDGMFYIHSFSADFGNSLNQTWENVDLGGEKVEAEKLLNSLAVIFNTYTGSEEGYQLAQGLSELGLCKIDKKENNGSGNGGGVGSTKPSGTVDKGEVALPDSSEKIVYEQVDSFEGLTEELLGNGVLIRVGVQKENGMDTEVAFRSTLLCFNLKGQNLMLYRFEKEQLVPVKYTAMTENGFLALLSCGGEYVVKDMPYSFADVSGWSKSYVEGLKLRGVIDGKAEGMFLPNDSITREEFVKLVVELFGMNDSNATCSFADVSEGSWYYSYVASAATKELVNGVGEGLFGIGQKIKRQDMAKIICSVLEKQGIVAETSTELFADDAKIADYAKDSVLAMRSLGIVSGDENGNFNPEQFASRQEAAKMISQMLAVYLQQTK